MAKQSAKSSVITAGKPAATKRTPEERAEAARLAAREKAQMLRKLICGWKHENAARKTGALLIAGVDEVGRGALFGPVVAAAVILPHGCRFKGLRDSKQLLAKDRERLAKEIRSRCLAAAVAEVDVETIDRVNIYQASKLAMLQAVRQLTPEPDFLLIDAMRIEHDCPQQSLIYGDCLSVSIAAASVIAKVYRDALLCQMDEEFPGYGLSSHKGYGTPKHIEALRLLGPSMQHRKSFAPVLQFGLFD